MDRRFKQSGKMIKNFAKGFAAAFSVRALVQFGKSAIDAADRIDKVSQVVGLSVKSFQELSVAAELSGVNVGLFESSMTAFVKRIGEANNGMGPLVSGLKNMDAALLSSLTNAKNQEEAFGILADAIKNAETATEAAAIANAAFGRSGIAMVNMLRGGKEGLDELTKGVKSLDKAQTDAAVTLKDKWTVALHNFTVEAQKLALQVLPSLSRAAEILGKHLKTIAELGAAFIAVMAVNKLTAIAVALVGVGAAAGKAAGGITAMGIAAKGSIGLLTRLAPLAIMYGSWKAGGMLHGMMNPDESTGVPKSALNNLESMTSEYAKQMRLYAQMNKDGREGNKVLAERHLSSANELKAIITQRAQYKAMSEEKLAAFKAETEANDKLFQSEEDRMKGIKDFTMDLSSGLGGGGGGGAIGDAAVSMDALKESVSALNESMNPAIAAFRQFTEDQALLKQGLDANILSIDEYTSLMGQLSERYRESAEEASKWGDIMKSAVQDFASGMADTLVDGILEGKMAFEDFAKSFLANIAKMIIQAQILAAMKAIPGIGSLFSVGTQSLAVAPAGITQFGTATAPHLYDPSAIAKPANVGSNVNVTVNNHTNSTVTTKETTDEEGNVNLQLMIENAVKTGFSSGRMDRSMMQFGVRRTAFG